MRPLLQKIVMSMITGSISFGLAIVTTRSLATTVSLAVFVAGVALVVQFLRDVEEAMASVVTVVAHVNDATRLRESIEGLNLGPVPTGTHPVQNLIDNVVAFTPPSPLLAQLVVAEMSGLTDLVQGLSRPTDRLPAAACTVSCEGEDRDWLLALTRAASVQILATSTTWADGGGGRFEDGFWKTELGRSYLREQQRAVERGVRIRRIFILTDPEILASAQFIRTCEKQREAGIEVRVNEMLGTPPERRSDIWTATFKDFIVFDGQVSYEVELEGITPAIARTNLLYHRQTVHDRTARFEAIWDASAEVEWPPAAAS
jgi:hypothetical protein